MKDRLNVAFFTIVIILTIFGFWGEKVISFLSTQYSNNYYPQLFITIIGLALGIPSGLFINSLIERKKDRVILFSVLTFIKIELVSNLKNIENLQQSGEKIFSSVEINGNDLKTLGKFTAILTQESYVAAQSSIAFASIHNDELMNRLINAYLNIQRIIGGAISFEDIELEGRKAVLIAYIKLCERTKESIHSCLLEIDTELKKIKSTITIIE